MRLNIAIPEAQVAAPILDAALEATTRLDESLIRDGIVPTFRSGGLPAGVVWRPEPPGAEHFDHAARVLTRGWGDCDDLAPWHAASLRATHEDPGATAIVRPSGPSRWHAVVQRSDGSIDDPSREAGMGQHSGVHGAVLPLMHESAPDGVNGALVVRPSVALRPVYGGWQARADMPLQTMTDAGLVPTDYQLVTLRSAQTPHAALRGALDGALYVADRTGTASLDDLERMSAFSSHLHGMCHGDVANIYGEDNARAAEIVVGSFLSKAAKLAKKGLKLAASPAGLAAKVVAHVPGVGPVASSTLKLAERAASGDTGALKALAKSPLAGKLIQFIPGVGPVMSEALQAGLKALDKAEILMPDIPAALSRHANLFPSIEA